MDQWGASRASTGPYGQSQYGQPSSGEAQPPSTYSYGQGSTGYTYQGTTYGQQSQQQPQSATAPTAAAPSSSAYYGYTQQQSYGQPSYGAQTGGTTSQSAYGSTATPAYGTAAPAQGQASQGGSQWGQGTATADPATSGGTNLKYNSSTAGGSTGQYGGAYGSLYAGAGQGTSQQAAGTATYGAQQQQGYGGYPSESTASRGSGAPARPETQAPSSTDYTARGYGSGGYATVGTNYGADTSSSAAQAPDYGTSHAKAEADPYASTYGSKTANYGVQSGGYGQGATGYDTGGAADATNPYASSAGAPQRTQLQQGTAQQGPPASASARAPSSPVYGHGSAAGGIATSYGRGAAAPGAGAGFSGGAGSAQYGPGSAVTGAGNMAPSYQGGSYGQAGAGRGSAQPYGGAPGYGVAPSAAAAQAQQLASQYNPAAAAAAGRGSPAPGGGPTYGLGRGGGYGPSGFGGPGPYGHGAPGGYGGGYGGRELSAPGRDGGFRGSRDRDDQRPSFRREFDRPRDRPDFRDRDHDRDRDRDRDRNDRDRGDRDRDRDRGRDKDKERDREGSHKRDDYKREERSSKRERASPRKVSYLCKIEPFSWVDPLRDYQNISRRYSKLFVVPDFCKMVPCWVGKPRTIMLGKPLSFEHEAVDVDDEDGDIKGTTVKSSDLSAPASKPAKGSTVWNAKVMLVSGIDEEGWSELLGEAKSEEKGGHAHNVIKFVALRRDRSAIMAPGGSWDPTLDGGDPESSDDALIRAAIRHTKEQTSLDLSSCTKWTRFLDVYYERAAEDGSTNHTEVTAMFLPDVSEAVPTLAAWKDLQLQRALDKKEAEKKEVADAADKEKVAKVEPSKEKKSEGDSKAADSDTSPQEEVKKEENTEAKSTGGGEKQAAEVPVEEVKLPEITCSGLVLTTKKTRASKMRSMTISLDGLLDYDEEDREEVTFELSLFAESFHEYLQTEAGSFIHAQLEALRPGAYQRKKEDKKRKEKPKEKEGVTAEGTDADKEGSGKEGEAPERKRSKFSDSAPEAPPPAAKAGESVSASMENGKEEASELLKSGAVEAIKEEKKGMIDINVAPDADAKMEVDGELERKASGAEGGGPAETGGAPGGTNGSAEKSQEGSKEQATAAVKDLTEATPSAVKQEDVPVKTRLVVNQELLKAYRYFDRSRSNYLKAEDLRRLLHCLGLQLSHRNVKDLVSWAVSESGKSRDDRVMYRSFTDKEEVVVEQRGQRGEEKGPTEESSKQENVKQEAI